jgi:hypothetical protein
MSKSVTQQIEEHVEAAIDALAQGDKVEWFVAGAMGPQGQITHFITIVIPSPLLGQSIQAGGVTVGAEVTGEAVSGLIQQALEHVRETRSRVLTEALTGPAPDHTNIPV